MISVIVPIYISKPDKLPMTEKCLKLAIDGATQDIEWIIVETGSTFFEDRGDVYIHERKRGSCTRSFNRGFKCASREYTVLLTNDVFLEPGWDKELIYPFDRFKDCGMTTLATPQLGHKKSNLVAEGVWCSIFAIKSGFLKQLDYMDEAYVNSWDDSDLVMRVYLEGYRMYRNYKSIAEHNPGQTHYADDKHMDNFKKNRDYFVTKFNRYKDNRMYKILTEGWVI